MASQPDAKRKRIEYVDLVSDSSTDDEEGNAPVSKAQKRAADINARRQGPQQSQRKPDTASYPTPPVSSALQASSQAGRGYQGVYPSSSSLSTNAPSQSERDPWSATQVDGDDVDEIVSSTQDAADNDKLQNYGDLPTKIVGVRFYKGFANPGEYILMRREPGNAYDSNAIRIDNVAGNQIGHIPRTMAAKLAKYMDNGWLYMEGRLAGEIGFYECPLEVRMFGPDWNSVAE